MSTHMPNDARISTAKTVQLRAACLTQILKFEAEVLASTIANMHACMLTSRHAMSGRLAFVRLLAVYVNASWMYTYTYGETLTKSQYLIMQIFLYIAYYRANRRRL